MNVPTTIDAAAWLGKYLEGADGDTDLARAMLARLRGGADVGRRRRCSAVLAMASAAEERANSRNGYRLRPWDTRVGHDRAGRPQAAPGVYYPEFLLQPRRRAEQALVAVVVPGLRGGGVHPAGR